MAQTGQGGRVFHSEKIGNATLYLGDCHEVMPTLGRVDAVVTDPPYGIGEAAGKNVSRGLLAKPTDYGTNHWDDAIDSDGIDQAISISDYQIVFGGNYYALPPTSCWLVWDKLNTGDFADCELAWTNLKCAVRRIQWRWNGMIRRGETEPRVHPTQKPVGVMTWCIERLPDNVETILDPFMGSGTTGVAAAKMGKAFIGIERGPKYFDIACRRIEKAYQQPDLFVDPPARKPEQADLLAGSAA